MPRTVFRRSARRRAQWLALLTLLAVGLGWRQAPLPSASAASPSRPAPAPAAPVTSHPRLFIRGDDLPRLRQWAVAGNPIYQDGLLAFVSEAKADMDAGRIPQEDGGSTSWELYPTERYAELFAFMSLISPNPAERADYGARARTLLMYVMNKAVLGAAPDQPFRDPAFSISDRSRWSGEAFALATDWIYPLLSAGDKATIRTVFLRWIQENQQATTTTYNHPEPIGMVNNPALVSDPERVRWAGNNYYAAHMRNIGLMSMALDPADDPGGALRGALGNATGAWLYVTDHLLRGDLAGGLPSEGLEYGPQTISFIAQFLLALQTAGQDDPAVWGPQVVLNGNPFWARVVPGYLHALSARPVTVPEFWRGPVYQPSWYGSAQNYWMPDMVELLAPLALHAERAGNPAAAGPIRWIETYAAPGGPDELVGRVSRPLGESALEAIFYFLLFDPTAPPPADPRPGQPLDFVAPGLGRIMARTGWDDDATIFGYALGWNSTDHQSANGNHIELYRKGEWLLKQRTGYDLDYLASDNHNTLAIQNDPPQHNSPGDWRNMIWQRGSQWHQGLGGDGRIVAQSLQPGYAYASGDATELYNAPDEGSDAVTHASRSVIWLKPDVIVLYDRAATASAGYFKRFWLNLPALPAVSGRQALMTTAGGQRLAINTLLPANAQPVATLAADEQSGGAANGEPMQAKLMVQAPGNPADARCLHVLPAGDAGAPAAAVQLIQTSAGTPFAGAAVGAQAVLFPVALQAPVASLTYVAPAGVQQHFVAGLAPGGAYDVIVTATNKTSRTITVRPGAAFTADSGGVLVFATAAPGASSQHLPLLAR
ncbi:MAG TPA: hypothetical protein VGE07_03580 [Herpetosiphonaceae bacterium]